MSVKNYFAALASLLLVCSCSDDDEPTPAPGPEPGPPGVTLEVKSGVVSNRTAAVQARLSDHKTPVFMHLFTKSEYEALGDVKGEMQRLSEANDGVKGDGNATYIYDGLAPSTQYVAVALAGASGELLSTEQFSTTEETPVMYEFKGLYLGNNGDYDMKKNTNFSVRMYTTDDPDNGWWENNAVLTVDCNTYWLDDFMPQDPQFFQGVFTSTPEKTQWGVYAPNCNLTKYGPYEFGNITDAQVAVSYQDGQMRFLGFFVLESGEKYWFDHTGVEKFLQSGKNTYGYLGYEDNLEQDLTGLDYSFLRDCTLLYQRDGVATYTVAVVNDPDPKDPNGGFNRHCIRFTINSPVSRYPLLDIPTGRYEIKLGGEEFTATPGDIFRVNSYTTENGGCYYYNLDKETNVQVMGFLRKGYVDVARKGDVYTFTVDGTTNLGYKVSGSYTGEIAVKASAGN